MKILRKAVACTALLIMTSVAGAIPVTVMNGTHDMVNGTLAGHLGLSGLGHTSTLLANSAAGWTTALASANPIVIEQGAYSAANAAAVNSYLSAGGRVILTGDFSSDVFMNALFGWTTSITGMFDLGTSWAKTAATAGTSFADDAASLVGLSSTHPVLSGVPAGLDIYYTGGGAGVAGPIVFRHAVGAGEFFYVGWDYCCGGTAAQANDWYGVLDSALAFERTAVPEPGMLVLLGAGLFGMGLARRRNKKA